MASTQPYGSGIVQRLLPACLGCSVESSSDPRQSEVARMISTDARPVGASALRRLSPTRGRPRGGEISSPARCWRPDCSRLTSLLLLPLVKCRGGKLSPVRSRKDRRTGRRVLYLEQLCRAASSGLSRLFDHNDLVCKPRDARRARDGLSGRLRDRADKIPSVPHVLDRAVGRVAVSERAHPGLFAGIVFRLCRSRPHALGA